MALPVEQIIFSWMNNIFITKQICKKEFNWKNIKLLLKSEGYIDINKDEINNIISKFKRTLKVRKTTMYDKTIKEVLNISKTIELYGNTIKDGRVDSSIKELPF